MTELLEFAAFTVVPALGLILGAVYVAVLILGLMLFHQTGEMASFFANGVFRDPVVGELPETAATLIAAGSVYYVLAFVREQRRLNEEFAASQTALENVNERLELTVVRDYFQHRVAISVRSRADTPNLSHHGGNESRTTL